MTWLVWGGAAVAVLGAGLLVLAGLRAVRIRRVGAADAEIRAAFKRVAVLHAGGLALAFIGLMLMVFGGLL